VAVGALTRVAVAALAQEHVRSLDLEYERRAPDVPLPAYEVQEDTAETGSDLHDLLHR